MKLRNSFLVTVLASFGILACTEGPETVTVDSVSVEPDEISLDAIGATAKLSATVTPENAVYELTWSADPAGVVTVEDGVVTAVGTGNALVTATAGNKSASCLVTVTLPETAVESISLDKTSLSFVLPDERAELKATVTPADADFTPVWSISPEGIATVGTLEDLLVGYVTPLAPGKATVTVTAGGQSATCEITITQPDPVSLTLTVPDACPVTGYTVSLGDEVSAVLKTGESWTSYQLIKSETAYTSTGPGPKGESGEYHIFYPSTETVSVGSDGYSTVAFTVGAKAQTQSAADNTEHLATPLYGYATSAGSAIAMKQAATYFDIAVTNGLADELSITRATLTNSEGDNMVGTFYINAATGTLKAADASSTATLSITGCTLSANSTAHLYLACAPFSLEANSTLTLTLTTSIGELTKTITVADATSYAAGASAQITASVSIPDNKIEVSAATASYCHTGQDADRMIDGDESTSYHSPWGTSDYTYNGQTYTNNNNALEVHPLYLDFTFESASDLDYVVLTSGPYPTNGMPGVCNVYYTTVTGPTDGDWIEIEPEDDSEFKNANYDPEHPGKNTSGRWNFKEAGGVQTFNLPEVIQGATAFRFYFFNGYGGFIQIREVDFYAEQQIVVE